jgi:hypothetical protein
VFFSRWALSCFFRPRALLEQLFAFVLLESARDRPIPLSSYPSSYAHTLHLFLLPRPRHGPVSVTHKDNGNLHDLVYLSSPLPPHALARLFARFLNRPQAAAARCLLAAASAACQQHPPRLTGDCVPVRLRGCPKGRHDGHDHLQRPNLLCPCRPGPCMELPDLGCLPAGHASQRNDHEGVSCTGAFCFLSFIISLHPNATSISLTHSRFPLTLSASSSLRTAQSSRSCARTSSTRPPPSRRSRPRSAAGWTTSPPRRLRTSPS